MVNLLHYFTFFVSVLTLGYTTSAAPSPISTELLATNGGIPNAILQALTNITTNHNSQPWTPPTTLSQIPLNTTKSLQLPAIIWTLSSTLTLEANIGSWRYEQERIRELLRLANKTVGKKPADRLLTEKFTQEEGSRLNTLYFKISPVHVDSELTWGDVAVLFGENGLVKFFEYFKVWTSMDFELVDGVRGPVGEGAVRKWYH